jgi:hypothetical protein
MHSRHLFFFAQYVNIASQYEHLNMVDTFVVRGSNVFSDLVDHISCFTQCILVALCSQLSASIQCGVGLLAKLWMLDLLIDALCCPSMFS